MSSPSVPVEQTPAIKTEEKVVKAEVQPGPLLLNQANFLVNDFVSKEASRYVLGGLLVSDKGTCATDGHVCVRVSLPDQKGSSNYPKIRNFTPAHEPAPFMIPRDTATKLAAAMPKGKTAAKRSRRGIESSIPILKHVAVGQGDEFSLELAVTDLDNTQVFQPRRMTGQFPQVDTVFASAERDAQFEIAVNPDYLMRICRAAAKFTSKRSVAPCILIRFSSADKALGLYAKNDEGQMLSALCMPIRMGGVEDFGLKKLPAKPPMAPTIPTAVKNIPTVVLDSGKKEGE